MPTVPIFFPNGAGSAEITATQMMPLGGAMLENARQVTASVSSDATGNFVLDITSAGFTEPPNVQAQTTVAWAGAATSAMLEKAVVANISSVTKTEIRGFVTQPNTLTLPLGSVTVKLASAPVSVSLLITGKTG